MHGGRDACLPTVRLRVSSNHPVLGWAGCILFWAWGGLIPRIGWNLIEMMIGQNLLAGNGPIVAPLDPPALWRPPLGSFLCAFVELFTADPCSIYRIIYSVSLTAFLITAFYTARALWGATAGHVACLFILTCGALGTRLASHFHGISHVVFLLVAGPALACSVLALRKPTVIRLFTTGVCWGLTYLARWETLPFFVITFGVLLYRSFMIGKDVRACAKCSVAALGFALLFAPAAIYQSWAKARFGIWGPSAITVFYASEAYVTGTGDEAAGFIESTRIYGSLEDNHFSLLRAIARNPDAFRTRLRINIPKFCRLFTDGQFFDPAWLLLLAGFAFDPAWVRRHRLVLTWLLLLFLSSTVVCIFHPDSRYLTVSLPSLLLLLCGGLACFGNWASRILPGSRMAAAVACLIVLGLRTGSTTYRQLVAALNNPLRGDNARAVEIAHGLATSFLRIAHPDRPVAVMLYPYSTDSFLLSYFAGTALCWKRPGIPLQMVYPRDKLFSMIPKDPDYHYVPEEYLFDTDLLLNQQPVGRHELPNGSSYYLFRALAKPFSQLETSDRDVLETLLARDYPFLLQRFKERAREKADSSQMDGQPKTAQ